MYHNITAHTFIGLAKIQALLFFRTTVLFTLWKFSNLDSHGKLFAYSNSKVLIV